MKNQIISSIPKNMQSNNLHSEVSIQESDEKRLKPCKKSTSITLAMMTPYTHWLMGMCVSLMILVIPFTWFVLCMARDENNQTGSDSSDLNEQFVQSPDYFRGNLRLSIDKFGYHVVGKIPEYRIP